MGSLLEKLEITTLKDPSAGLDLKNKRLATARPNAVFGEPVTAGEYTIITASEVGVGMGFGYGGGGGSQEMTSADNADKENEGSEAAELPAGFGVGIGGGGGASGRPVASIIIGPEGVRVEPIVDVTKIGIALLTTIGTMLAISSRMHKMARG